MDQSSTGPVKHDKYELVSGGGRKKNRSLEKPKNSSPIDGGGYDEGLPGPSKEDFRSDGPPPPPRERDATGDTSPSPSSAKKSATEDSEPPLSARDQVRKSLGHSDFDDSSALGGDDRINRIYGLSSPYDDAANAAHDPSKIPWTKDGKKRGPGGDDAKAKEKAASTSDGQDSASDKKEDKRFKDFVKNRAAVAKEEKRQKKIRGPFKSGRMKIAIAAGILAAIVSIFGTVALLPTWALNQLQERAAAALEDRIDFIMEKTTEKIIKRWLRDQLPGLEGCGSTINRACTNLEPGDGPLKTVYKAWAKERVDLKLESRLGIRLETDGFGGGRIIDRNGKDLGSFENRGSTTLKAVSGILDVSEGKNVRDRWLIRHAIKSKYGFKWCLFLCKDQDALGRALSP